MHVVDEFDVPCVCGHALREHYKMRWGRPCYLCATEDAQNEIWWGISTHDGGEFHLPADRKAEAEAYNWDDERRGPKRPMHSYWGVKTEAGMPLVIGYE